MRYHVQYIRPPFLPAVYKAGQEAYKDQKDLSLKDASSVFAVLTSIEPNTQFRVIESNSERVIIQT